MNQKKREPIMKKYKILPLILLVLVVSCKDYLEFPPEGEIPQDEFFSSQEDAQMAVNAMYGYLRFWDISAFSYLILGSLPSDEIQKGSSPGDGSWANDYDNFQYTKTEGQIKTFWSGRYQGINLSNQVITQVPSIEMNEDLKSRMVAEATFLRAFHYYYLARAFGGVPLLASVPAGPEGLVRTSLEETWNFIETDLRNAIPDLPETVPPDEYGRATRWSAKALLAKVLMYREDWIECKKVSDEIISGPFDLYPDFYQLFRPEQEFCQESLFEIVATQVSGEGGLSNCQFAEVQAVRGQFGWGWFAPTDELAAAFDAAGDTVRKKVTIIYKGDVTEDGDIIGGVDVMEGVDGLPRYNGKAYVPTRIDRIIGPYGCDQNVRILRLADILLINAEAAFHTGGDAATPLNRVRERAGLAPIGSPTLEDIWEERRLELAGEQDRYWDLLRTGRAATVLAEYGFKVGKHEWYPLPQTEIELSGGQLIQNPGW
ncbi:MAG: RagB/SusD family nutrient uptake outer membrane protein [Bacteroidales bacterium]